MGRAMSGGAAEINRPSGKRRGGALFEVMLSIAIFAAAGAFALGTTRAMLANLNRAHKQQQAVDLARSKIAELKVGLIHLADLQSDQVFGVGTFSHFNEEPGLQPLWNIHVRSSRSEHSGLNVVEVTVTEQSDHADAARYTLRQLMHLREVDGESEYEQDDLLEGLQ